VFVLICVGLDTLWRRRLHPAFAWGALLFVGASHLALHLTKTSALIAFGESLVSFDEVRKVGTASYDALDGRHRERFSGTAPANQ
jgi:hypothetical protein